MWCNISTLSDFIGNYSNAVWFNRLESLAYPNWGSPPAEESLVDQPPAGKPVTVVCQIRVVHRAHIDGVDSPCSKRRHDIS